MRERMGRRLGAVAIAAVIGLGGVTAVAVPATAAPVRGDDKDTVCLSTAKTVTNGLNDFVTEMKQASVAAQSGDLAGAEAQVKTGGTRLVAIGTELRAEAAKADDKALGTTVTNMATEFETLGKSLTSLSSLQSFDSSKLDGITATMSQICGTTGPTPFPS